MKKKQQRIRKFSIFVEERQVLPIRTFQHKTTKRKQRNEINATKSTQQNQRNKNNQNENHKSNYQL